MIKQAKLISNEFVIGNMIDHVLTNVMLIRFKADSKTGEISANLVPYMAPLNNNLAKLISMDKCIVVEDADPGLQTQYLQTIQNHIEKVYPKEQEVKEDGTENNNGPNGVS